MLQKIPKHHLFFDFQNSLTNIYTLEQIQF